MDKENVADVDLNQVFYTDTRLKTFDGTNFEKFKKCSAKKLAEAGFYFSPTEAEDDKVTCFTCGIELFGWSRNDDPWTEHLKASPKCVYLEKKKSYANDLAIREFLEVVKQSYLTLNESKFERTERATSKFLEKITEQEAKYGSN